MSGRRSDTGPFAVIPEWVLDSGISDGAIRQYAILARYADSDSGECWPSRKTLGERQGCSVDTVDRRNAELEKVGALLVAPRRATDGDQLSNAYTLLRVRPGSRTDAAGGSRTDAALTRTIPEREPIPPDSLPLVVAEDTNPTSSFVAFWDVYPRKVDRRAAKKAYEARRREGVSAERLLAAVEHYARAREGEDSRFTKHAKTFLAKDGPWSEWEHGPPDAKPKTEQELWIEMINAPGFR